MVFDPSIFDPAVFDTSGGGGGGSGSFTIRAVLQKGRSGSFTIDARIRAVPVPRERATVSITIGGTDVTDIVRYSDCTFRSVANGQPGECRISIKDPVLDPNTSPTFPDIGDEIILTVNGDVVWGGWVMGKSHEYAFPVEDTSDYQEKTRFLVVNGVDYNFLFSRRFVYDQADPTKEIAEFPAETQDTEVISTIFSDYFPDDLTALGFDLTSGITNVGSPGQHEKFRIAAIGDNLGVVFSRMSLNLGAIFYFDPDKVLRWVDDETVTAPYILSDRPVSDDKQGYRELSLRASAEVLCNDMFVRGAGAGSPDMVVSRNENTASIERFGRWQYAELHSDMYKQATADIRSNTYVNGSPQNRRGHKNPLDRVHCVIYQHGFRVGQVVNFEADTFGWQDNIPIREMGITFPVPGYVRYELTLNHDIDPGLQFADWPGPPGVPHLPWGEDITCSRDQVTDTFTRTTSFTPVGSYQHRHWTPYDMWVVDPTDCDIWYSGEFNWLDNAVDPYGAWAERTALQDTVVGDTTLTFSNPGCATNPNGNPGLYGDGSTTSSEPAIIGYDYGTNTGTTWGVSDSGETWQIYQPNDSRPVLFYVRDGVAVYEVRPYEGPGSHTEAGMKISLGTQNYPVELYFEGRFADGRLPGIPLTTGEMVWLFGDGGGTSDMLRLIRQSDLDQKFYLDPAGSPALQELSTGLLDLTEWFAVRIYITADTIYGKVWQLADEEPFGYQGSIARSGTIANSFMVRASSSANDVLYYMDNLTLVGLLGGCQFFTTYPYVPNSLKASVDGVNVTVLETGDRSFEIPSYTSGQIQVNYVRSDAYEGDGVYDDNPDAATDYFGGGSGEWQWPCTGYITQEYGCTGFGLEPPRGSCAHFHDGIDIANASGTPLYAPAAGTINYIGWNPYDVVDPAYIVVLDIPGGYQVGMAHLLPIPKVSRGQSVAKGQLIGLMGNTGNSTGSHVHFEARYNGDDFNPRLKLEGDP